MADHFYTPDAVPAHGLDIREVRRLGYYPSVTTILRILNKASINEYLIRQSILAALTLPRTDGESDDSFIERVIQDGKEAGEKAAVLGTGVHALLGKWFAEGVFDTTLVPPAVHPTLDPLHAFLKAGTLYGEPEVPFACHSHQYGGQIDLIGTYNGMPAIVDFKTQSPKAMLKSGLPSFTSYPEWAFQLAAYRAAVAEVYPEYRQCQCVSIIVSVNPAIPGIKAKVWSEVSETQMNMTYAKSIFNSATIIYRNINRLFQLQRPKTTTLGRPMNALYKDERLAG